MMASLLTPQLALAAFIKLSGTMPTFGDVQDFQISPDGQYVVYRADQDTDEAIELYSVPMNGGIPVRLNGALPTGSDVADNYKISPDSSRVIYRADQQIDEVWELYSVPLAGPASAGVKLNGALVANGNVWKIEISPDSSRVIYLADQQTDGVLELYSVPLAGPAGAGVKLNGALVAGGDVIYFQVSPDSSRVVYQADQQTDEVWELYSVPLAGPAGAGVKLNGALVAGGGVKYFPVSPDSSRVIYLADQQTDGVWELYSVPLAGPAGTGVKLNGALVAGGEVWNFEVSPDSSRVIYLADQQTDGVLELYSVPLAGPAGAGVKLNGALVAGGDVNYFQISPDSSRVIYQADQQTDEVWELYSLPLAGPAGAGVKLNGALAAGGDVDDDFQVSPDSSRVIYLADQQTDEVYELYSVPLAGPASAGVKLNGVLVAGGDVWDFEISPDSSRVVYWADQETDEVVELYSIPLTGPAAARVKLNGMLVANGDVHEFKISSDSSRVVYRADQDTDGVSELYVVWEPTLYLPIVLR
jgi:Tol biopolymer transport system component